MKIKACFRYPKVTGTTLTLVTVLAGATALAAADFGAPGWVFVPLLVWLATIGLPSTVAVLLLAAVWGTASPFYGFAPFCIAAALLAGGSQVVFVKAMAHFAGGCHES